ncbi:MAG: hypothetical protein PHQ52_01105 [Candidatus Omnitrophica bacterium]|nr:hypothetical protein [Candidatus Omnitrophota bacterium]
MKKYTPPKTKAIVLDQKQAIVQVCMIGGLYLLPGTGSLFECASSGSQGSLCENTPKGGDGEALPVGNLTTASAAS